MDYTDGAKCNVVVVGCFSFATAFALLLYFAAFVEYRININMRFHRVAGWLVAGLSAFGGVYAQECVTNTVRNNVPASRKVALRTYSYCGGILNVTVGANLSCGVNPD